MGLTDSQLKSDRLDWHCPSWKGGKEGMVQPGDSMGGGNKKDPPALFGQGNTGEECTISRVGEKRKAGVGR